MPWTSQFIKPDATDRQKKAWRNLQRFQLEFPTDVVQNEGELLESFCYLYRQHLEIKAGPTQKTYTMYLFWSELFRQFSNIFHSVTKWKLIKPGEPWARWGRTRPAIPVGCVPPGSPSPEPSPCSARALCLHLLNVDLWKEIPIPHLSLT